MQELRLVAANERGTHLVLRSPDGDKFLLCIDERLKAAARGDRSRFAPAEGETGVEIRPRDIQARIRSGASAEQVARSAGVPVDRVRRFEGPVLAEREHIASLAQKSTVRRHGLDARPATLIDVLTERLTPLGVTAEELGWDSWRRDDGRWVIQVAYSLEDATTVARYLYDPRARSVLPEDDEARWLTGEIERRPVTGAFVPRVAGAIEDPVAVPATLAAAVPEAAAIAAAMRSAAGAAPTEPSTPRRAVDGVRTHGARRPAGLPRRTGVQMEVPLPEQPQEAFAPVAPPAAQATPPQAPPVLEKSAPLEPPRETNGSALGVPSPAAPTADRPSAEEAVVAEEVARTGTDNVPARPRGRRASVPAWDDIVFGARRSD